MDAIVRHDYLYDEQESREAYEQAMDLFVAMSKDEMGRLESILERYRQEDHQATMKEFLCMLQTGLTPGEQRDAIDVEL